MESPPSEPTLKASETVLHIEELLGRIFLSCVREEWDGRALDARLPVSRRAPLVLSYVCRSWRQLTRAQPDLWTQLSLTIKPHHRTQESAKHLLAVSDLWLRLSAERPLTIRLQCLKGGSPPIIYDQILPHVGRLRELGIIGSMDDFMSVFNGIGNDTPMLEVLRCGISYPADDDYEEDFWTDWEQTESSSLNFITVPNLKDFSFSAKCGAKITWSALPRALEELRVASAKISSITFDCISPQIRTLTVTDHTLTGDLFCRLSTAFPRLEKLDIDINFVLRNAPPDVMPICRLPSLRSLTLGISRAIFKEGRGEKAAAAIFANLYLPSPDKFELYSWPLGDSGRRFPHLSNFLKRCQPKLRSMSLDARLTDDDFVECLHELPDLEELSLGFYSSYQPSDAHIDALIANSSELTALGIIEDVVVRREEREAADVLCPRLLHITLPVPREDTYSLRDIVDFVLSRRTEWRTLQAEDLGCSTLQRCTFLPTSGYYDLLHVKKLVNDPRIMQCIEGGLRIEAINGFTRGMSNKLLNWFRG